MIFEANASKNAISSLDLGLLLCAVVRTSAVAKEFALHLSQLLISQSLRMIVCLYALEWHGCVIAAIMNA